ncbi:MULTISPECIES: DUF3558 domain-containing protein [unclassified Rhodococcus (in: high G+C Gram-positive bacteria)]|uniref:DUF3558 domain-containing protein n=1 Tax=unclassified Rhodococcus (in: high G+C Gram-positive bacteria) TaxID=192944 RepID=UPI000B9A727A|nr:MULTISPECIES: DUF3558 domain-containing protein [unclassified Rhodococcus (in: high G+C Gram-positive bacteria)]OZE41517.1 hypothetical protein CH259_02795 [Rhodococcus sp. 05-2254-4]OZE43262.1 hypothetical protein CH261_19375 [Rhodococcus sp. 05-2254-3]OZE51721.1 hypothetical protein CH283_09715 [Rhodococcus sp. 05-2254-2]OZF45995.1 hypothetical protein CH291_17045 [Rhodococcus sp. 14-1411-2a]
MSTFRSADSTRRVLAAVLVTAAVGTGCTTTVTGTAVPARSGGSGQFDKLLGECIAVPDPTIAETVGADLVEQYFYGAVCMWTGIGGGGLIDVTFAWFENDALSRERDLADRLGYATEDVTVAGTTAFLSRRPDDPSSCGISAAYSGVITWWVQYRGASPADPCAAATELAELTLQRNQ